jgi:Domain of unknown function (DUF4333)
MTHRRNWPVTAAAIATGLLIAACGSATPKLNGFKVERGIAQSILAQHRVDTLVRCPPGVPVQEGVTFTCTANLQVGSYPVSVVELDGAGHVRWANARPLVILDIARVERSISDSIRAKRGLGSHVTCPAQVLQEAGVTFTCEANVGGRRYPFTVTEVDGHGDVRYVGR